MQTMIQLLAALLFAGFGASVEWGMRRHRIARANTRERERYPVAGEYITYFQDLVDSQTVYSKAPMILAQEGRKVVGTTEASLDGREWKIEGQVLDGGYISGHYFRSSPHDPGRGTFFVEPVAEDEGDYKGLWGGFDSVNRGIMSGDYTWHRRPQFSIETLLPDSEFEAAGLALLSDALGRRYITKDDYASFVAGREGRSSICAIADHRLVGVRLTKVLDDDEETEFQRSFAGHGVRLDLSGHRSGLLKSSAVRPEYRGKGIGGDLASHALDWLRSHGCTKALAVSWSPDSTQRSEPVLKRLGFEELARIERYWYDDSLENGYDCPSCGNVCSCTAILFSRLL